MAGYSGTPLAKKLGHKPGMSVVLVQAPDTVLETLRAQSEAEMMVETLEADWGRERDIVHLFTRSAAELERLLPRLHSAIKQAGMIWISWPKKASKQPTDITEDGIRSLVLAGDLVDVKVCAVDDIWSGLKLVIRKERRN